MSLEKIIKSLKKAACIGLASLALAFGGMKEAKADNLRYDIVRLKVPDVRDEEFSGRSYPYSINNRGKILGVYCDEYHDTGFDHSFLYDDGDMMIRMPWEITGCFRHCYGDDAENRMVINDLEFVLRSKKTTSTTSITYICAIGEMWQFDFFGEDINNYLNMVGEKYLVGEVTRDITEIAEWPDVNSPYPATKYESHAINDKFQMVGSILLGEESSTYPYFTTHEELAFFLGRIFGKVILLERPYYIVDEKKYYYNCHASDINNNGKSVGWFGKEITPGVYSTRACMWDENGNITQLDPNESRAYAINDNSEIVGYSDGNAVLYKDGERIDLNSFLPENFELEHLIVANGINNKGQIIGYGSLRESTKLPYGFLANPLPLEGDLNKDNVVNLEDLAILSEHWLEIK